jgi:hypothetical protein
VLKFEKRVENKHNGKLDFLILQPKQNCNMNKYFDLNRSTSTVRPQPFTGISTKIAWADGFPRDFHSKMAKKPPDTEGSPFQ